MDIVKLEHVSISYDGRKNAVDDVSFTVGEGQIVGIVGESGSGKSTLLHSLIGLLQIQNIGVRGTVEVLGKDMMKLPIPERNRMRGKDIGMIYQDTGRFMNPIARVEKQYTDFLRRHEPWSVKECIEKEKDMLTRVQLNDTERILRSYPFELSGGMRQRVGIAMAMTLNPRILLADEPTSALDVTVQAQVVQQMMDLRKKYGTSIVIVTHNIGVAAYMSDYIGVMNQGKLVEWGKKEDVINHPQDPYTRGLLDTVIELKDERLADII